MREDNQDSENGATTGQSTADRLKWWEEVDNPLYKIHFSICCAMRYCKKRCNTFELLHTAATFIALFGGSVAVGNLLANNPCLGVISGLIAAGVFAADSAIGFSRRAEKFDNLCKRYTDLKIKGQSEPPSKHLIVFLNNEMDAIEKDAPAALRVLDVICHNQEASYRGIHNHYHVDWWRWLLKDVWSFDGWLPQLKH